MPDGSLLKFARDARPGLDHGSGKLLWPGTADGFPVRVDGPAPNLKQAEFDELRHVLDYRSKSFDLWVPEQKTVFDTIMEYIVNGLFMQHKRVDTQTAEGLRVWLEWVQIYGEIPATKQSGANDGPITLKPKATSSVAEKYAANKAVLALGEVSSQPLGRFDEECWGSLAGR
jgi:hypothetical protein